MDALPSSPSGQGPEPSPASDSGTADDTGIADTGAPKGGPLERSPSLAGLPTLTVMPVDGAILDSGFGPRRVSSEGYRTDFHPGLDLDAPAGTPVRATARGVVHRVEDADSDEGIIVLAHTLDTPVSFHGETIHVWYARYLHLDGVRVREGDAVAAGDVLAVVSDSTDVVEPHVHFEVRLGTWCSLRYSTENPDSGCARTYDPAINPLSMLSIGDPKLFTATVEGEQPLQVRVTLDEGDFDLNRIEVDERVLDFDHRTGMNARSEAALDDFDYGWVSIDPIPDAEEPDHQSWIFTFETGIEHVDVYDIEGRGLRIEP